MGCKTCKPEELGNLGGIGKSTPSGKKPGADWAKGKGENGTGGLLMIYADNLYNGGDITAEGMKGGSRRKVTTVVLLVVAL